jgi:hypothetical protein
MMPGRSREEAIQRQQEHRAKSGRTDYVFLDPERRRERILKTTKECEVFLAKYLTRLDKAYSLGEKVEISLDTEDDYVSPSYRPCRKTDPHYWVKNLMQGVSHAKLDARKKENEGIDKTYKRMLNEAVDDKEGTKSIYWQWRSARHSTGLPKCSVMAIQLACTGDKDGDLVCAIHVSNLIKDNKGSVKLPEMMRSVLTHPAAIFVNANQFEDLEAVISQFYPGKELSIHYVEMHEFLQKVFGQGWNGGKDIFWCAGNL